MIQFLEGTEDLSTTVEGAQKWIRKRTTTPTRRRVIMQIRNLAGPEHRRPNEQTSISPITVFGTLHGLGATSILHC
uniref:Uncharacterized protein n=1 Tax=Zea mays TaxID=4577 RepID=B4FC08_MAIZE|nr:unknown [Zea mays]